jgi:hypothetical protein
VIDWPKGPLGEVKVAAITTLPSAADELTKAVDAVMAAEGALARAQAAAEGKPAFQETMGVAGHKLRAIRTYLMLVRGDPKPEPAE